MWQRRIYIRCAMQEDHQEWEKARQVVDAIARIMLGDGDGEEPTPENPVVSSTMLTGSGKARTEIKVKKVLNVKYEDKVKELAQEKKRVDADGPAALERLRAKWAGKK